MKKYLYFMAVAAMAISTSAQHTRKALVPKKNVPGFNITGTVEGRVDGDTVYLGEPYSYYYIPLDSAIIKNGKFQFKGKMDAASLRYLIAPKKKDVAILAFILGNENINVKMMKDSKLSTVSGSHDNDLWVEHRKYSEAIESKADPYWKIANDTTKTVAERQVAKVESDKYLREDSAYTVKFLIDNLPSGTSDVLLEMMMQQLNETTMQTILDKMGKVCPKDILYMSLMQQRKAEKETAVGQNYTDIVLNDPDGKPVKLSDYVSRNKVTMIDFWASWCGPCRAEMPNVVNAYKQYKDKGFAIVGVSLDNNLSAWKGAIEKLGITWPQMSDLNGWDSKGAAAYNIKAIPATVLINSNGKIIAKNLRGADLESKLKEILQ